MAKIRKLRKRRLYYNNNSWTGYGLVSGDLFNSIKRSAERRGILFKITIKDAWRQFIKQNGKCYYTGEKLKILCLSRKTKDRTASLDRKNSKYGYTRRNIAWVTKKVNMMKGRLRSNDFVSCCKKIALQSHCSSSKSTAKCNRD